RRAARRVPHVPLAQGAPPDLPNVVRAEGRRLVFGPLLVEVEVGAGGRLEGGRWRGGRLQGGDVLGQGGRAAPEGRRGFRRQEGEEVPVEVQVRRVALRRAAPPLYWAPRTGGACAAMTAPIETVVVDGLALANEIRDELARAVAAHRAAGRRPPCLAVVLVGDDPASASYIKGKRRACERVGMDSVERRLSGDARERDVV